MGLSILTEIANMHYNDSKKIAAPLISLMILQGNSLPDEKDVNKMKQEVLKLKEKFITVKTDQTENELSQMALRGIKDAQKQGASSWLNIIPLEEHGFNLNKSEFRDAVNLR